MTPPAMDAWDRESFFDSSAFISSNSPQGGVFLKHKDDILWILIEKEACADNLVSCFRQALHVGWLKRSLPTLIDLTRFTGAVDWRAIRAISRLVGRQADRDQRSRVAYLLRGGQGNALVKIASAMFPLSTHRTFSKAEPALIWLKASKGRKPSARYDSTEP